MTPMRDTSLPKRIAALFGHRSVRYAITVLAGTTIDIGIAMALSNLFGVDLVASSAIGFACALVCNYALFELWVFKRSERFFSFHRFALTVGSAFLVIVIRLSIVALLGKWMPRDLVIDLTRLVLAMGCSLIANYVLLGLIFASKPQNASAGKPAQ